MILQWVWPLTCSSDFKRRMEGIRELGFSLKQKRQSWSQILICGQFPLYVLRAQKTLSVFWIRWFMMLNDVSTNVWKIFPAASKQEVCRDRNESERWEDEQEEDEEGEKLRGTLSVCLCVCRRRRKCDFPPRKCHWDWVILDKYTHTSFLMLVCAISNWSHTFI